MTTRLWLAAVLGIVLGVGLAFAPNPQVSSPAKMYLPIQPLGAERSFEATAHHGSSDFQFALLALLAGVIVASPFFVLAKRRNR